MAEDIVAGTDYDPMIAKVIVRGATYPEAMKNARAGLPLRAVLATRPRLRCSDLIARARRRGARGHDRDGRGAPPDLVHLQLRIAGG